SLAGPLRRGGSGHRQREKRCLFTRAVVSAMQVQTISTFSRSARHLHCLCSGVFCHAVEPNSFTSILRHSWPACLCRESVYVCPALLCAVSSAAWVRW